MSGLRSIITQQSFELGDGFADVKEKIESDPKKYGHLKLGPDKKQIEYCTERIRPNRSEHRARIPILFLFSNPHPDSVRRGLFLSEPHSRTFWQRLFESDYFHMRKDAKINLECWDNKSTPEALGQLMLDAKYKSKFLLYFHCLWPIPTNQVADLKALFGSNRQLWEKFNEDSQKELAQLVKHEQIKHIVVFTGDVFNLITGTNKASYKGRRALIKHAIIDYLKDKNIKSYWEKVHFCHSKANFSNDVDVFLSLDTARKNVGKGMKKRYFTLAVDMILKEILQTKGGQD